ncbi:hypothetical protein ACN38_g13217 [Penicillium nordicum]|uniref:Uncharacterized protein n=1 Tax=Penicillium nordicum TaxID=229535 RepID=A0A0M8NW04_9EURO|nr:hypothetical protein ACN38_g13217 [Penicillium nordicum]
MHDFVWYEKLHFSTLPKATRTTGRAALLTKGSVIAIQVSLFFCRAKSRHQGINDMRPVSAMSLRTRGHVTSVSAPITLDELTTIVEILDDFSEDHEALARQASVATINRGPGFICTSETFERTVLKLLPIIQCVGVLYD